jgi:hypothetical protein
LPINDIEKLKAYGRLNEYLTRALESKPNLEQASVAVEHLFRTYGAESEEELLQKADPELVDYYKEIKAAIIKTAQ